MEDQLRVRLLSPGRWVTLDGRFHLKRANKATGRATSANPSWVFWPHGHEQFQWMNRHFGKRAVAAPSRMALLKQLRAAEAIEPLPIQPPPPLKRIKRANVTVFPEVGYSVMRGIPELDMLGRVARRAKRGRTDAMWVIRFTDPADPREMPVMFNQGFETIEEAAQIIQDAMNE